MTDTIAVPSCPRCSGAMWDNRLDKKNPKAPDFKCRDKACVDEKGFVTSLWVKDLAKAAPRAAAPAAPVSTAKQPHSSGPYIEGLDEAPAAKLDKMFALYSICYSQAHQTIVRTFAGEAPSQVAVCAAAATLFIAAKERGLAA